MMALATHQVQKNSYAATRPLYLKKRFESKNISVTFPIVKRTDIILLKQRSCLCVKVPLSNRKSLKISSFKGNVQNDESGSRGKGSKSTKNSIKLSYVPKDRNETLDESSKVNNNYATATSNTEETAAASLAIQQLFRSWLTLLRTPSQSQIPDGTLEEGLSSNEVVEPDHKIQKSGRSVILKAVWHGFLGLDLDPAIKMPPLIFIPMYLAVNMKYGPIVTKDLAPLWICGPLLVALYIKIVQGLCVLYIYSFKQSGKVVQNLPVYYNYVLSGKLKETIHARLWLPVVNFMNLGYKGIWKRVQEWIVDKYLDYIESIWPHYCKLIRFLKRANFI